MKCPKCGSRMLRDSSNILTSMPPKYEYRCPKCGAIEYGAIDADYEEEVVIPYNSNIDWEEWRLKYAGMAMQGLMATDLYAMPEELAENAVMYADALIAELKKQV